jgi:RNA recognition motif-containing protein
MYNPRDRKDMKRIVNNIYVKNFPMEWDEAKLREIFSKYGNISSMLVRSAVRPGQAQESKFAFICFSDEKDPEYGPKCAQAAIDNENG